MNISKGMIPLSMALAASVSAPAEARAPSAETAAASFVAAGDRQDVAALEQLLHPSFRVLAVTHGKAGEAELSRAQYLQLVREKKLGGDERKLEVLNSEQQDRVSFVRLRLHGKQASFEALETWVKVGEQWLLIADHVVFTPKA